MKYKVIDISEEDYGCEGIPEDSELMCSVLIESSDGTQKWVKIADRYLRENDIDIGSVFTALEYHALSTQAVLIVGDNFPCLTAEITLFLRFKLVRFHIFIRKIIVFKFVDILSKKRSCAACA